MDRNPEDNLVRSDSVGEDILGEQPGPRYRDLMGARVNTLRARTLFRRAELGVAYFGPKYRQWNTATDAGAAVASGLPLILVRDGEPIHALEELDALAALTVETLEQAAAAVAYIFEWPTETTSRSRMPTFCLSPSNAVGCWRLSTGESPTWPGWRCRRRLS